MGTIFFNDRDVELYNSRHQQLPGGALYLKADGTSVTTTSKMLTLAGSRVSVFTFTLCVTSSQVYLSVGRK